MLFVSLTDDLQKNVWRNVSVSLVQRRMITLGNMLVWKLSAPCRLEGEVWPCHKTAGLGENSCKELEGFRKQLDDTSWQQNKSNQIIYNRWVKTIILTFDHHVIGSKPLTSDSHPYFPLKWLNICICTLFEQHQQFVLTLHLQDFYTV